ncbi:MAG: hypothetical protein ACYTGG_05710 [Planctomycetota bacterium]|jgi:hypothetical protein
MRTRPLTTLIALLLAAIAAAPLAAQDASGAAEAALSDADRELASCQARFRNLYQSLQALGGVSEAQRPILLLLRDEVASFSAMHPGDERAVANERMLCSSSSSRCVPMTSHFARITPSG